MGVAHVTVRLGRELVLRGHSRGVHGGRAELEGAGGEVGGVGRVHERVQHRRRSKGKKEGK